VTADLNATLAKLAEALTELGHYQPTSLADTHDLLTILAGDGPYSVMGHLGTIIARLGNPSYNRTLHQLPDQAAELLQTATDYFANVVLEGEGGDVVSTALTAIAFPCAAPSAAAFLAKHGVQVDEPTDPAVSDTELEARLDQTLARLAGGAR
jgi:hypothetical protein